MDDYEVGEKVFVLAARKETLKKEFMQTQAEKKAFLEVKVFLCLVMKGLVCGDAGGNNGGMGDA